MIDLTVHHPTIRLYHTKQLPSIANVNPTNRSYVHSHLSIEIVRPVNPTIRFSPQSIAIDCHTIRPIIQSIGYQLLPLFAIDCLGFTPWAGVCRVFDAGREEPMRVSLGSLPLFSNFPQSLPTDSRNQLWT